MCFFGGFFSILHKLIFLRINQFFKHHSREAALIYMSQYDWKHMRNLASV